MTGRDIILGASIAVVMLAMTAALTLGFVSLNQGLHVVTPVDHNIQEAIKDEVALIKSCRNLGHSGWDSKEGRCF